MGSFDRAEVCELSGLYILQNVSKIYKNNVLYKENKLGFIENSTSKRFQVFLRNFSLI